MAQTITTAALLVAKRLVGVVDEARHVCNGLLDGPRRDAMLSIERFLQRPAAARLGNGLAHAVGDRIRIHDDLALSVTCCAPHGLYERAPVAEESLFVGVQNCHERDLRNVEALAQ